MQIIPLQPIPNQSFQAQLGTQTCTINLFQYQFGLFLTLFVGTTLIVASVPCENLNRIVRSPYLGFSGDLVFWDQQGSADPIYTGLGSRWQLVYVAPGDLPATLGP
jgi:hypothetical protein